MAQVSVKNFSGDVVETLSLDDSVFGLNRKDALIHQVYVAQQANERQVLAHTKTRAERAGSGRKPWKQKGTGRARVGSVRSPIWRKGGVTFGPTNERNFSQKVNKKMNTQAIKMVLSGKVVEERMIVINEFDLKEVKTKAVVAGLKNLSVKGSVLMAYHKEEQVAMRAGRNIPRVDVTLVDNLNVSDMLDHGFLIISKTGVQFLEKKYAAKKAA